MSIDALRSGIKEHEDRNAESTRRIQEAPAAIGQAIGDLAAKIEAIPDREDPALAEGKPDDTGRLTSLRGSVANLTKG